jgi:hypothetical protein
MAMSVTASAQMLQTRSYGTTGHPTEAMATPDGQYVLVTVDLEHGQENASGIDVFHDTGKKLERVAFQPLGAEGAQGIVLIPRTRTLAVGMSNAGVAFLSLDDALLGKAKPKVVPQGEGSGSGYLAVTPDGQFLFVANEYGDGGNLGVIALHRDEAGALHPETLAHVPTPNVTPGVTASPDGSRIYTVAEVVTPEIAAQLAGHGVAEQERQSCVQRSTDKPRSNGVLYVIDVAKATALNGESTPQDAKGAVITEVDSGCSPVDEPGPRVPAVDSNWWRVAGRAAVVRGRQSTAGSKLKPLLRWPRDHNSVRSVGRSEACAATDHSNRKIPTQHYGVGRWEDVIPDSISWRRAAGAAARDESKCAMTCIRNTPDLAKNHA